MAEKLEDWKARLAYKIAKLCVIIGVVGELLGDAEIFETTARLQVIQEKVIQNAKTDAANAISKAATIEREAAHLRIELDREIQKRLQRSLKPDQISAIRDEVMGKLDKVAVVIQHDIETQAFAIQIMGVLNDAGVVTYAPEPPRDDKWFAPGGLIMYAPDARMGSKELETDPLFSALRKAKIFGGTTAAPYASPDMRPTLHPALITGYSGRVLYIGQKSPF